MAKKGDNDESKMLFDIRGRRRNVIKVVYAVLALLMGLSLILLAGPIGFGGGGPAQDAAELSEERAEEIEERLRKEPENSNLLLSLTRAQINTANALAETNPATGEISMTLESRQEYQQASQTWSEYLEATDEPAAGAAQLVSSALFSLAQSSRTTQEARSNITAAAEAQRIVAEQRPSLGTLSTLAFYTLYTGNFEAAEGALAEARQFANSKFERRQLEQQYEQIEETAREFQQQVKAAERAAEEGGGPEGGGEGESLQNPFSLGGGSVSE